MTKEDWICILKIVKWIYSLPMEWE